MTRPYHSNSYRGRGSGYRGGYRGAHRGGYHHHQSTGPTHQWKRVEESSSQTTSSTTTSGGTGISTGSNTTSATSSTPIKAPKPVANSDGTVDIGGVKYRTAKNGSKLIRVDPSEQPKESTPRKTTIQGVSYVRTKSGNLLRKNPLSNDRCVDHSLTYYLACF
ncbi:hypothetical protein AWJ20_4693 [Sugiyamaella lignohabitans]|uniref:Uncharacterized protein n=1 Tax=Sugiyamaella lignohabitans TaxID=796027 RepID=A0A167E7W2_9ASCO|nr:uncharacterized protein AWJ20_4693 [Sugiyamaella lignohabitans]ANB13749.1 hypothetical protein AWJ20_4693 [Sugiyamaella lignohabitans]